MIAEFYGGALNGIAINGMRYGVEERIDTISYEERAVPQTVRIDDNFAETTIEVKRHVYRRFCQLPDRCVYVSINDPSVQHWWMASQEHDAAVAYAAFKYVHLDMQINREKSTDLRDLSESMLATFDAIAERKTIRKKVFG